MVVVLSDCMRYSIARYCCWRASAVLHPWRLVAGCIVLEPRFRDAVSCGVGLRDVVYVVFCDGDTVQSDDTDSMSI